jgi:hypothetical protein
MSGSPSTKFVGRSFNDQVTHKGYKSDAGLAQPATGKSFLVAAHVRINGGLLNLDGESAESPFGLVLANFDDVNNPTKGFGIAVVPVINGFDPDESIVAFTSMFAGNGSTVNPQFQIQDITGLLGRDVFVHFWFDADEQEIRPGYNGKWGDPTGLGEDFEPATDGPTYVGGIEDLPINCNNGLVSVESVAVYESPDQLDAESASLAVAEMVGASMKYGTLMLFDPEVPNLADQNAFHGKMWTHTWRPGSTSALAPETVPDSGDAVVPVPLNRECAADEAPLVIADTGFGSGTLEEDSTDYWSGIFNPAP